MKVERRRPDTPRQLHIHVGGFRQFGGVDAPLLPMDVQILVNGKVAFEGVFQKPTTSKTRRIHRASYHDIEVGNRNPTILKVVSKAGDSEITKTIQTTRPYWIHVDFDLYPADHPHKDKQGLSLGIHEKPQVFR